MKQSLLLVYCQQDDCKCQSTLKYTSALPKLRKTDIANNDAVHILIAIFLLPDVQRPFIIVM